MRFFVAIIFVAWLALAAMAARVFREPLEKDLVSHARQSLDGHGLSMVGVEFDHLDATLFGNVETRKSKLEAERVVEAIRGARVVENRISFGKKLSPILSFSSGDPVRVTGRVDPGNWLESFGAGFDLSPLERVPTESAPWQKDLAGVVGLFFESVDAGGLEFDGPWVTLSGVVANAESKWEIMDEFTFRWQGVEVLDQLEIAPAKEHEVTFLVNGSEAEIRGRLRDGGQLEMFAGLAGEVDSSAVQLDSSVRPVRWFAVAAPHFRRVFELAIESELKITGEGIEFSASFADEFWLAAAERKARQGLPQGIGATIDFSVARKAEPEGGEGTGDQEEKEPPAYLIPIKIDIADNHVRLQGKLRTRDERSAFVEQVGSAREGLEVINDLAFDYREPRIPGLRGRLPEMFSAIVKGVDDFGSIDLGNDPWQVSLSSHSAGFLLRVKQMTDGISAWGIPIQTDLRLRGDPSGGRTDPLQLEPAIYFRPGSAQLLDSQLEKIAGLAEEIRSLPAGGRLLIIGRGAGGDLIARQRARAVRRSLVEAGLPVDAMEISSEPAGEGEIWKDEKVRIESVAGAGEDDAS